MLCSDRKLAVGELAVVVEAITINKNIVPVESYQIFCEECKFRNVEGYIKIKFDKYEGILPRSIFEFYTSPDVNTWDQVGFTRTKGKVIDFVSNNSYIEIGGHSDGQSFGNTFLDAEVKSLEIITSEKKKKYTSIRKIKMKISMYLNQIVKMNIQQILHITKME